MGEEAENSSLGEIFEGTEKGNKAKSGGHYLLHPAKRCILPVTSHSPCYKGGNHSDAACRQSPELLDPSLPNSLFNDVKRQESTQTLLTWGLGQTNWVSRGGFTFRYPEPRFWVLRYELGVQAIYKGYDCQKKLQTCQTGCIIIQTYSNFQQAIPDRWTQAGKAGWPPAGLSCHVLLTSCPYTSSQRTSQKMPARFIREHHSPSG